MKETKLPVYSAAVIIIGNEILSGRTQDTNLRYLACGLNSRGIRLREARVISDMLVDIIKTLNELRARYDYVFTTGGIGPTHDDVTAEAVAQAFSVELEHNAEAVRLLSEYYGEDINEARLRMARMPAGVMLLENPVSQAPGFQLENVYVLPGVPSIMQAMFDGFKHRLAGGQPMLSRTVRALIPESSAASGLATIQQKFPDAELGSYPYIRNRRLGTALVVRSVERSVLEAVVEDLVSLVYSLGEKPEITHGEATTSSMGSSH